MVEVSKINRSANNLRVGSEELEERKRQKIENAAEAVSATVGELREVWEMLGLSGREAEVAAYRELGFTNRAIALMTNLSRNTVNEYTRRASNKYETAQQLVSRGNRTTAFDKNLSCRHCGHGMQRSKAGIEFKPEDEIIELRCRNCWEPDTRRLK